MLFSLVCAASLVVSGDTQLARSRPGLAINACGVLTGVPGAGLASVDGPAVQLGAGFAEWFGISFTAAGLRHHAVGAGSAADWAGRVAVREESFEQREGWARARTSCEALAIESEFTLAGELLFVRVTLTNRGALPLEGILCSREWRTGAPLGWTFPPDWEERPAAPDVGVRLWMPDDLAPGASAGLLFSWRIPHGDTAPLGSVDVPLELWRDVDWPNGLVLGSTNGVSFGDYDADGWSDLFVCESARLLRNVQGLTWELAADLDSVLPATNLRYGSSFGDYDNDGLPDIGTEPRATVGDSCLHLLRNLGGASFLDVAVDPALMTGQPCGAPSETISWGDVDADGDLDLFLPVYPRSAGGPGNFFLENLGPTGPGGQYRFVETSRAAGLDNPPGSARPEGAQFVDLDADGAVELYSNGTLYQNRSSGSPLFVPMTEQGSGIGLSGALDEGAAFFDYDLDGDQDLFIVYTARGVRLWEGRGDGTFFQGEGTIIDQRDIGLDLGLSAEDWDNDGDIDFTTRQVFRQNRFVEEGGARHFTVATHTIPGSHLTSATPAWGDWDKDGDLDCALGNWQSIGHFYANVLWGADTPLDAKPYVRVRVVRDSATLARGLETEYGANVELVLQGDPHRREKFTASGHGYLNQNEYVLHFALPRGPDPKAPLDGLVFDLVVDFPSDPARGVTRIDRHVNPALGSIRLAELSEREITVFRSGRVVRDGRVLGPTRAGFSDRLRELGGGLARPDAALGLPDPLPAASPSRWVGLEFATGNVDVLVKELVLDGTLASGAPFELVLWDVSDTRTPRLVRAAHATTSDRNRRTHFPFVVALERGRTYRCAAHVASLRRTSVAIPWRGPGLELKGGLDFEDVEPASGAALTRAQPDARGIALSLRYVVREGR